MPTLVLIVLFLISFENQCFEFLKTVITNFDTLPKNLQRLQDIEQLPEEDKKNIFYTIDGLIKAAKLKNIAAM